MADINLIKKNWITEKAVDMTSAGKYVFGVTAKATKPEIRKAVKALHNVDVIDVKIVNTKKKPKTARTMSGSKTYYKPGVKKAIVTLKAGQKIDLGI